MKFNLDGDTVPSKEQHDQLLNMAYDNQEGLSLHAEDLGFCDRLTHTIPVTNNNYVYLPHRIIPHQLQEK